MGRKRSLWVLMGLFLGVAWSVAWANENPYRYWHAPNRVAQAAFEKQLNAVPEAPRLSRWHQTFASHPHWAGTEGDRRVITELTQNFEAMGLDVEVHPFWTWLAQPVDARVEIISVPETIRPVAAGFGIEPVEVPMSLPVRELEVEGDSYSGSVNLTFGWNAYSGSGDVIGEVVYANFGTREDFAYLDQSGIDLNGKIVLARYGGNFRGFKAKFAEAAGAAALIIFTDPGDAGFARGAVWPEGGYANGSYIQRGSIKTLGYPGDPLTPFKEASKDAERLDPEKVALPRIPVQPIGWAAAFEIIGRMQGDAVPADWQGGLPVDYRMTGGEDLTVRVQVTQSRSIVETANVLGTIKGAKYPDEWIIVGCHHDAWGHGAGDPNAGTMLVYEVARSFSEMVRSGNRPDRSIVFANWGAEEFGIIGSVEWVEANAKRLTGQAVAYINLDGATMGHEFAASSAPLLKGLIEDVARVVPSATDETQSVWDQWTLDGSAPPKFGNLGGGSDHIGFWCHLGVPSCGVSARGARGVAYHSNYDNLAWYRKVIGDDYKPALMLTRMVNLMVARLANSDLLPLDPVAYGDDIWMHLDGLRERAMDKGVETQFDTLYQELAAYRDRAEAVRTALLEAVGRGQLRDAPLNKVNQLLRHFDRVWVDPEGLPGRPWYRNLFAATDPYSGYAPQMLPLLDAAVVDADQAAINNATERYREQIRRLNQQLDAIEQAMGIAI